MEKLEEWKKRLCIITIEIGGIQRYGIEKLFTDFGTPIPPTTYFEHKLYENLVNKIVTQILIELKECEDK